ncbi:MAG: glycosyltransferase family 4 protein [bacterium]|nr:glycosyltransferase family 4 protein [bacterium]MDO8742406.1 glycosyltransferase family 4 protein [bacterium]
MKRIGIFSLAYLPHIGGAEVAIKEITDRTSEIEFHLFTLNFGKDAHEERIGNIFVHRVGSGSSYLSKILFAPRAAFAARKLHRVQPFNAFWAMLSYMLFPIVLLRFFGVRVPYLLTLQEGDPWEHMFSRWFILPFRPLLSAGFRHVSAVQAISMYLAQWAKRMGYIGSVDVIPNGCDTVRFGETHLRQDRELFWKHKNINGADTILITTSRLVRKNAIDVVIRALALLPKNTRFVILGSGLDRVALEALAGKLEVIERVHFLGDVPNSQTPQYLHASDIFVRPSRTEGMGISFIEAMAAGLPVIATQAGGIADFLFDAKRNPEKESTGWAVDAESPEQVAVAVKEILANPEQVVRVTTVAKKLVSEQYDWNLIAQNMAAIFDRLIKSR